MEDEPEVSTVPTGPDEVCAQLIQLVRDHDFEEALNVLKTLPACTIKRISWDVLPVVFAESDDFKDEAGDSLESDEQAHTVIDDIISLLSGSSTPKEVLLLDLETLPSIKSSHGFALVVESIDTSLRLRTEYSKASLIWALEVISDCLGKLPPPEQRNYENAEERKLMDAQFEVTTIISRFESLLTLLRNQYHHLDESCGIYFALKDRLHICAHLVRPLGVTLGLLDISPPEGSDAPSTQYLQALTLARFIERTTDSLTALELADCRRSKFADDELKVDSLSVGVLAYIVFCLSKSFPRVYSPDFLADILLTLSPKLLASSKPLHVLKGLDLAKEAFVYVNCVRKSDSLQLVSLRLLKALFQVMTLCPAEEARKKAMALWNQLFEKCHPEIRLEILFLLFKSCDNPSVRGFIVDTWRKQLVKTNQKNGSEIIQKLICLPEEEKTDLLHHSEYLLASLSMLRHLLLRRMLEKHQFLELYLTDFKKALQLSRAHYELRLKADRDTKLDPLIPNVPRGMEKNVLEHALTRLDLMESVLGLVQSLYDSM